LHSAKHFVITYECYSQNATRKELELGLQAFLDANFAMTQSRHSQSGFVSLVASSPIS